MSSNTTVNHVPEHFDNPAQPCDTVDVMPPRDASRPIQYTFGPVITTLEDPEDEGSIPRKRGRPKGSAKVAMLIGPKRPRGRPPGSGKNQRAALEGNAPTPPPPKRRAGRPRKDGQASASDRDVSVQFGKFVVPGVPGIDRSTTSAQTINAQPRSGVDTPNSTQLAQCGPSREGAVSVTQTTTAATAGSRSLINLDPWEDSTRSFILNDEDEDDLSDDEPCSDDEEAHGDGIGSDDEEEWDDSDDDDGSGDEEHGDGARAHAKPRSQKPLRPWLLEKFNSCVAQAADRNSEGLPRLYWEHRTFWFPQASEYFLLRYQKPSPQVLYNPRFFLWDPLCLVATPCPRCKTPLIRHGTIQRPRRVVDLDSTFWIIGYRYHCTHCTNSVSGRHTVTFNSWDSRILAVLPPYLAEHFPARFTRRSGISITAAEWMRSCFQKGMGAKQFSACVSSQHSLRYDKLNYQYLSYLAMRQPLDQWRGARFMAFLPYEDPSPLGYGGYVPCASMFRDIYDREIEEHKADIDQHTSMLPLNVGALDHSHKVPKHIARFGGKQAFPGMLAVTNENGEIHSFHLVTSTGHSQTELALSKIAESLEMYGHDQPKVMYMDNIGGDKQFLERVFSSSLTRDVIAVEDYSYLPELRVPRDTVSILVKSTAIAINLACQTIMDDLGPDGEGTLVVGFDTEWNIDVEANDRFHHRGPTALVQIAYRDHIYIFQVGDMICAGTLPIQLWLLLQNPNILKVGRNIDADLGSLEAACHSTSPFVGAIDLARLAKEHCVIHNITTTKLSDLAARILHKRLNKNVSERLGTSWDNRVLTEEQVNYAALDPYASIRIYEVLNSLVAPHQPTDAETSTETPVVLYRVGRSIIALGRTVGPGSLSVPAGSAAVEVTEVIQSAAKPVSQGGRSLGDFGKPPFVVAYPRSNLLVYQPHPKPPTPPDGAALRHQALPPSAVSAFSQTTRPTDVDPAPGGSHTASDLESDGVATVNAIEQLLGLANYQEWLDIIRSRVLKDPFHLMDLFPISLRHGLTREFFCTLRDALFIFDRRDANRIALWGQLQQPKLTFEQIRKHYFEWLKKRSRRFIPPPEILYPRVYKVLATYGPLKDATTNLPLFDAKCWNTAKNVLELIRNGHVSDWCFCSTNTTEGVHTQLRPCLPTSGVSLQHVEATMYDLVISHNLDVGTLNTTGEPWRRHYSIWYINGIEDLELYLGDRVLVGLNHPGRKPTRLVNGNHYHQTTEKPIGILRVPKDIQEDNGIAAYSDPPPHSKPPPQNFLAKSQGTRKPILPIHTRAEIDLFHNLMQQDPNFDAKNSGIKWKGAVRIWNLRYADGNPEIFYKLSEHMNLYLANWKTKLNTKQSKSTSASTIRPVHGEMTDMDLTLNAPSTQTRRMEPHSVPSGQLFQPPSSFNPPALMAPPALSAAVTTDPNKRHSTFHSAPTAPTAAPFPAPSTTADVTGTSNIHPQAQSALPPSFPFTFHLPLAPPPSHPAPSWTPAQLAANHRISTANTRMNAVSQPRGVRHCGKGPGRRNVLRASPRPLPSFFASVTSFREHFPSAVAEDITRLVGAYRSMKTLPCIHPWSRHTVEDPWEHTSGTEDDPARRTHLRPDHPNMWGTPIPNRHPIGPPPPAWDDESGYWLAMKKGEVDLWDWKHGHKVVLPRRPGIDFDVEASAQSKLCHVNISVITGSQVHFNWEGPREEGWVEPAGIGCDSASIKDEIWMGFAALDGFVGDPVFGATIMSNTALNASIQERVEGGKSTFCLNPQLVEKWKKLEWPLFELTTFLGVHLNHPSPIKYPFSPTDLGIQKMHPTRHLALTAARKARTAFQNLFAYASFILSFWYHPDYYRSLEPALLWAGKARGISEQWIYNLLMSKLVWFHNYPRRGMTMSSSSPWLPFAPHFADCGIPVGVCFPFTSKEEFLVPAVWEKVRPWMDDIFIADQEACDCVVCTARRAHSASGGSDPAPSSDPSTSMALITASTDPAVVSIDPAVVIAERKAAAQAYSEGLGERLEVLIDGLPPKSIIEFSKHSRSLKKWAIFEWQKTDGIFRRVRLTHEQASYVFNVYAPTQRFFDLTTSEIDMWGTYYDADSPDSPLHVGSPSSSFYDSDTDSDFEAPSAPAPPAVPSPPVWQQQLFLRLGYRYDNDFNPALQEPVLSLPGNSRFTNDAEKKGIERSLQALGFRLCPVEYLNSLTDLDCARINFAFHVLSSPSATLNSLPAQFDVAAHDLVDHLAIFQYERLPNPAKDKSTQTVLEIARHGWTGILQICRNLARQGIPFYTARYYHSSTSPTPRPVPRRGVGTLDAGRLLSGSAFQAFKQQYKDFIQESKSRAGLALKEGGYPGRITRDLVNIDVVCNPPSKGAACHGLILGRAKRDEVVISDYLEQWEQDIILARVLIYESEERQSMALVWPSYPAWDVSGVNTGSWNDRAEEVYQKRLSQCLSGNPIPVHSSREWQKSQRLLKEARVVWKAYRSLADGYLTRHGVGA
ncbi:hypothetical protein DFP72DRAFT_1179861 [Ephemerocybe angulata]|uniref:3'-5' exonuclease n=1 Tax=Ephemerocybe angulata TaxID=980116 RepID=A0A8H6H8P3_9AGAR|nr:hypothetical protein DFP72DRAFT_1179861 [Tulosesus angulatus]